ncbi:unnamed protein product [Camellia sinensis]
MSLLNQRQSRRSPQTGSFLSDVEAAKALIPFVSVGFFYGSGGGSGVRMQWLLEFLGLVKICKYIWICIIIFLCKFASHLLALYLYI